MTNDRDPSLQDTEIPGSYEEVRPISSTSGNHAELGKRPKSFVLAALVAGLLAGVGAGAVAAWTTSRFFVEPRLAALEDAVSLQDTLTRDVPALREQMTGLKTGFDTLDKTVKALPSSAEVQELGLRLSKNETMLTTLAPSAGADATRFEGLEERLKGLEDTGQVQESAAEAHASFALRLALARELQTALLQGSAYANVLAGLAPAGISTERQAALEPFASSGAPTGTTLARVFEGVIAQASQPKAEANGEQSSFWDRLKNSASRLVRISSAPDAGTVRIKELLNRSAFKEAQAAFATLSAESKAASEGFLKTLDARAGAEEAAQGLVTDTLAGLEPVKP